MLSHKKRSKTKYETSTTYENVFQKTEQQKREGGEKGGEQEQQRERREQKKQGRSLYTP